MDTYDGYYTDTGLIQLPKESFGPCTREVHGPPRRYETSFARELRMVSLLATR